MIGDEKIVEYSKWCQYCLYLGLEEHEDPCHECLSTPVNSDSHKPVMFKIDDTKKVKQ